MNRAYIIFLFTVLSSTIFSQSFETKRDSFLQLVEAATEDTIKASFYNELAALYSFNQPKIGIDYAFRALSLSKKSNYYEGVTDAYRYMFNCHFFYGSDADSLLQAIQLLENHIAENANRNDNKGALSTVFWNYGIYYGKVNQTDKEIEAYINALEIVKKTENSANQEAELLCNIGVAMNKAENYQASLEYYQKALKLIDNTISKGNILANMASTYETLNNLDTAKVFYEEAYKVYEETGSYFGMSSVLISKGRQRDREELYQEANQFYSEALEIIEVNEIDYLLPDLYEALSNHYLFQKEFQRSIYYGEKGLKEVSEQEHHLFLSDIYKTLDEAYTGLGDYKKAHEFRGMIIGQNDSISSASLKNKIEELETVFSVKQKEQENELLKAQQEADQVSIRNRTIITVALLMGLLLAIGWSISLNRNKKQRQKYNQELETKNEELKTLADAKTRFFANISHEYKTPLTLIMNPIQKVLRQNDLSEDARFLIKSAEKNSLHLYDLTNQVLELTKLEANKTIYNPINFNLFQALKKTYADFESLAVSRNIDFQVRFDGDESLVLYLDYFKFSTIIKNLISNALKFTPDNGRVIIDAQTNHQDIIINVTDNGRGIHNDDLPHVFDRYYQAKNTITIQEGGTGIGLAICNEFTKIMNGQISVNSQYGKGSQFMVRIPIVTNTEANSILFELKKQKIPTNTLAPTSYNDQLPNILLVEDNLDMQAYIRFVLKTNYNIFVVPNGKVALTFLEEKHQSISLIISDLMMPEMNGYELIKHLKQTPKYATIPTIMLTALSTKDDKLKALRIGIDDYLTKPFVDEELMARIDNLIQYADERKAYRTIVPTEITAGSTATQSDLAPDDLEWLVNLEKVVKKHCSNSNLRIDVIAVEMSVSQTGVFRKVKRLTGLTPKKYIDEIRFQTARELLETRQNYTIKAVAMNVGFKDEKNFSRNFKKRFGKYPSDYLN